jgi:putative ABC transport system substrate-binding protein
MKASRMALLVAVLLGGLVARIPAEAQQAARVPRIGILQGSRNENATVFAQALRDEGYVDGQSARIEMRFYAAQIDRLPTFVDEFVTLKCDVILATSAYAIRAATTATKAIPIVGIDLESDPVANGWAGSLGRPGGNLTGLFLDFPELGGKQIQLLKEVVPRLSRVGVVWDSNVGEVQFRATEAGRASRERRNGVIVLSSPLILNQRSQIAALALTSRLPTISLFTVFPRSGGLMAYGPDFPDMYRRAVTYIDRILKGAKAGDLPIERPSRFELAINVKTARTLGLTIPPSLMARTDHVVD